MTISVWSIFKWDAGSFSTTIVVDVTSKSIIQVKRKTLRLDFINDSSPSDRTVIICEPSINSKREMGIENSKMMKKKENEKKNAKKNATNEASRVTSSNSCHISSRCMSHFSPNFIVLVGQTHSIQQMILDFDSRDFERKLFSTHAHRAYHARYSFKWVAVM